MASLVIPNSEDGSRLDRCIRRILGNVNQGLLEKHLRSGFILLDNKKVKSSEKVKSGQLLQYSEKINFSNSTTDRKLNQDSENFYKTLYDQIYIKENDHYIALNKPSGLAVQGGSGIKYNIDEMLQYKFGKNKTPKLIHRIDKDTSGLLLVAKDQISAKKFANYFKERKILKVYLALVSPVPKKEIGTITSSLIKSGIAGNQKMIIDDDNGKISITEYRVLNEVGSRVGLLALYPKTGRTHQLRVHLESINAPILGDRKYTGLSDVFSSGVNLPGHKNVSNIKWKPDNIKNLQLHAFSIKLPSGESIEAPLTDEFKKNLDFLGLTLPSNLNHIFHI
jgi:23S rRNA pseudouridine955/2504/2580 synthase